MVHVTLFKTLLFISLASTTVLSAPVQADSKTLLQNAQEAQNRNTAFLGLRKGDPCPDGTDTNGVICVSGSIGACQNNKLVVTTACGKSQGCLAMPALSGNGNGIVIQCTSPRTAISVIEAAGATGGLFGSNSTSSPQDKGDDKNDDNKGKGNSSNGSDTPNGGDDNGNGNDSGDGDDEGDCEPGDEGNDGDDNDDGKENDNGDDSDCDHDSQKGDSSSGQNGPDTAETTKTVTQTVATATATVTVFSTVNSAAPASITPPPSPIASVSTHFLTTTVISGSDFSSIFASISSAAVASGGSFSAISASSAPASTSVAFTPITLPPVHASAAPEA